MQMKSLYTKIALCALITLPSVASASALTSSYAKLQIGNVCLAMNQGKSYEILPTMDFYIVESHSIDSKITERIYIGYNPDVGDGNRNFLSRKLYKLPESRRIVRLSGPQSDQILGIPREEKGFYFHIMSIDPSQLGSNKASLVASSLGVSFC
jgi:hypothetical protein